MSTFVCTWYQPAPKIRISRYVCTRATPPPKKNNRRPSTGSGSDTRTTRQSLHSNHSRISDAPRSPTLARHPLCVGHRERLLCGKGVEPPRGSGKPSGARESQLFFRYITTKTFSKIHLNITNSTTTTTTTEQHYMMRIFRILGTIS